jgi:alkylation response protein AidB-like acyl-CoA dehydrogenase
VQRKAEADALFQQLLDNLSPFVREGCELEPYLVSRIGRARVQLAALDAQCRAMLHRLEQADSRPGLESLDKLLLTEVEQEIFALVFDVLGPWRQAPDGRPFGIDGDQVMRDFFYSRSRSISGGTTQIQRNIVAQRVLGLPR